MSYMSVVAADSPLLWYRFRERAGTGAASSGSDSAYAYATQAATFPVLGFTGIANDAGAVHLVSTGGLWAYPNTALPASTGYTVEAWFFVQGQGPFGGSAVDLVVQMQWASISNIQLGVSNGNYEGYLRDQNGTGTDVHTSTTLTHNTWHQLVGVQHHATNLKELFVDGVSIGTGTGNTAGLAEPGQLQIRGTGNPACAIVAEVAVYTSELSSTRISAHFSAQERFTPPKFIGGPNGVCP